MLSFICPFKKPNLVVLLIFKDKSNKFGAQSLFSETVNQSTERQIRKLMIGLTIIRIKNNVVLLHLLQQWDFFHYIYTITCIIWHKCISVGVTEIRNGQISLQNIGLTSSTTVKLRYKRTRLSWLNRGCRVL